MAKIRAMIGSGGGDYVETVLWENPSPTATPYNATTVTLSQSIQNFEYLKFVYKGDNNSTNMMNIIVSVEDFLNCLNTPGSSTASYSLRLAHSFTSSGSSILAVRGVVYSSDTEVQFTATYRVNSSGSYNSFCIPLKILGLKKPTSTGETVLYTNSDPTASYAGQTITLSQSIENFKYIKFKLRGQTSSGGEINYIIPVADWRNCKNNNSTGPFALRSSYVHVASSTTYYMMRNFVYASDTTITVGAGSQVNGSYSNNSVLIPVTISGIN